MSDEQAPAPAPAPEQPEGGAPAPAPAPAADDLTAKLTAAEQRAAKLEERLAAIEAEKAQAAKEAEEAAAREAGKLDELYQGTKAERDALAAKLEKLEAREAARIERLEAANAAALEALPEQYRSLVPDGLDAEAKAAQIAAVRAALADSPTFPAGTTGGTRPKTDLNVPPDVKAEAARLAPKYPGLSQADIEKTLMQRRARKAS